MSIFASPLTIQTELPSGKQPKKREAPISRERRVPIETADFVGRQIGIDWREIDLGQFRRGIEVEQEHAAHDPAPNIARNDLLWTGMLAWANLKKIRDYYTRLDQLEAEAEDQSQTNNELPEGLE